MLPRFMQDQFLNEIAVLAFMGPIVGVVGIQLVKINLAVIQVFGMSGGANG
jgi:hypothetical protein